MSGVPGVRRFAAAASAVAVIAVGVTSSAQANPAPAKDEPARHCVITLAPLESGQAVSREVSRECVTGKQPRVAESDYLLMVWYQHMDYEGPSRTYKGSAPCDSRGYGIDQLSWPWTVISSYRVFNSCNLSRVYTRKNFGGTASKWLDGDVHRFSKTFNDKIRSIWIKRG